MYNDYILLLNNSYRKFRDKEKDANLFLHFMAILALKCIYDTREKLFPAKDHMEIAGSVGKIFAEPGSVTNVTQVDELIRRLIKNYPTILSGVFDNINFRELVFHYPYTANRLPGLLEDIAELSFTENMHDYKQSPGAATEYLIEKFVEEQFHKQGFLYTPRSISSLMVALADVRPHMSVYDPAAGLGTVLVQCAKTANSPEKQLYGQEMQPVYWQLCKLNMLFNGLAKTEIELGDSLQQSKFVIGGQKMKFDRVISHPPFNIEDLLPSNIENWTEEEASNTPSFPLWEEPSVMYKKNGKHAPELRAKDSDFLSHTLTSLHKTGKAVLVVPHGVLFKLGNAQAVRKQLVEKNVIEAVIDMPANIFYSSKVNVSMLVLNKHKMHSGILFIDASEMFEPDRRRNKLKPEHCQRIIQTYQSFITEKDYSYVATPPEVIGADQDYNLTAKRYVKQKENPSISDLHSLRDTIDRLTDQLKTIQQDLEAEITYFSKRF